MKTKYKSVIVFSIIIVASCKIGNTNQGNTNQDWLFTEIQRDSFGNMEYEIPYNHDTLPR